MPLNAQSPFDPRVPPDPAPTSTPRLDPSDAARLLSALSDPDALHLPAPGALSPAPAGFIIDCPIGRGGTASVYKAFQVGALQRPVAIKIYDQPFSPDAASRVLRELDLWQSLDLNCLPTLIQSGLHEGRLFVVTTFVDGDTLLAHARSLGLSIRERVELLARAADAVQTLNARGVLHRDIKPSNIMVAPDGRIVLIDLGLARLMDSSVDTQQTLTAAGTPVGTPAFMAPEQARGERIASTQTDVWGLGAAAYTLLTDHTPHATDAALHEVIRRIAQDQPRDPRALSPTLPRPLAAILSKACAYDPARRYRTAAELADDFRRWLKGEPVTAGGSPVWTRLGAWVGRHPAKSTAAVLLSLFAATFASLAVWQHQAARRPGEISINQDRSSAYLLNRAREVTHRWTMHAASQVVFGQLENCSAHQGRTLAILAFGRDGPMDLASKFKVIYADRPDTSVFEVDGSSSGFAIPGLNSRDHHPEGAFSPGAVLVADIFPDLPDREIVVLFRHSHYPTCLRIYSLTGESLMECWHMGNIGGLRWLPEAGVLLGAGVSNRDDFKESIRAQANSGTGRYAPIVFAIRPVRGDFGWIDGSVLPNDRGPSDLSALWYHHLEPWSACKVLHGATLAVSRLSPGSSASATLTAMSGDKSVDFEITAAGVARYTLVNDAYRDAIVANSAPSAESLMWVSEAPQP